MNALLERKPLGLLAAFEAQLAAMEHGYVECLDCGGPVATALEPDPLNEGENESRAVCAVCGSPRLHFHPPDQT